MAARQLLMRLAVGPVLALLLCGGFAEAAGPWKGQIVDRDTGKPIAGAVVLAIWVERWREYVHPDEKFHSAVEVVSDEDGRFTIPEHTAVSTKPLTQLRGPEIVIFKAGYEGWTFQGGPYYPEGEESQVRRRRIDTAWEHFTRDGVVLELRPITDRGQRLRWNSLVRPLHVPDDVMPRLLDALDAEGVSLGLPASRQPRSGEPK